MEVEMVVVRDRFEAGSCPVVALPLLVRALRGCLPVVVVVEVLAV